MSRYKMHIDIPVKPHVRQYLEKNIFFKGKDFVLTSTSTVGSFLMQLVEPKKKAGLPLRYNPANIIKVQLTDNHYFIVRPYVSPRSSYRFNLFMDKKIKEELFVFIDCLCLYGKKEINEAIKEFQIKYGFRDDDMSFDCLKKAYYRYRKSFETRMDKAS